jgi:hypothetical protein
MKVNLDLGQKSEMPAVAEPGSYNDYPEVYLKGDKELNLPEEGTITFKYCVLEEKHSERPYNPSYSCTLSLKELVSVESEKDMRPAKADKTTEDALDKLAKEKAKEEADETDEEGY